MIDLYTFSTPNGYKVSIALEEMGLEYQPHTIDITKGDQFTEDYRQISPASKIPAIVDPQGPDEQPLAVIESGAILLYLAEKTGQFLPKDPMKRQATIQWLFYQAGSHGPYLGQAHHFLLYAPRNGVEIPYAQKRYAEIAQAIYSVVDQQLARNEYVSGEQYTVADMAFWPWIRTAVEIPDAQGVDVSDYRHVMRWYDQLAARPAVQRGVNVPAVTS